MWINEHLASIIFYEFDSKREAFLFTNPSSLGQVPQEGILCSTRNSLHEYYSPVIHRTGENQVGSCFLMELL